MDEATVHVVDGLSNTPELLFVLGALAILAFAAIKVIPIWRDLRAKQIEADNEFKKAQIGVERDREIRKTSEAKMRNERELEAAAINARMVDAQERSTAAMSALTQQMAVMNGQLEMSKDRSAQMSDVVDGVAHQVNEIHGVVVRKEQWSEEAYE